MFGARKERELPSLTLSEDLILPEDGYAGALAARIWRSDAGGPSLASVKSDGVYDVSAEFPTMRDLCEHASPAEALRRAAGERIASLSEILATSPRERRSDGAPRLLAPVDLQAIKAAGVTFAQSLIERVIEERARGSRDGAAEAREAIGRILGEEIDRIKPGSEAAMRLTALIRSAQIAGAMSAALAVAVEH